MNVLTPTVTGWCSDDGYRFVVRRGQTSGRPIGFLIDPQGAEHAIAGRRGEALAVLLDRAEREIKSLRAGGLV